MQLRDVQHEAMRIYETLVDLREDWSGCLVLCCGSGCTDSGAPAAVSVAAGALLAVDSNAAAMKSAMRAGNLDFVVNTLDEALRTLKNEIRQKRPLSVGLIAGVETTLEEIVQRGLQPDLLVIGSNQSAQPILQNHSIQALEALGMPVRLPVDTSSGPLAKRKMILSGKRYDEVYLSATTAVELRALDECLLAIFPSDDLVRRRWIQQISRYLRDARTEGRWIWLSEEERKELDA